MRRLFANSSTSRLITITIMLMNTFLRIRPIRGFAATRSSSSTTTTAVPDHVAAIIESLTTANNPNNAATATFDVYNPANPEQVIAQVPVMDQTDAQSAIQAAATALPAWRDDTSAATRGALLTQWSRLIKDAAENIATIMTLESGKPLAESRGEVAYAASFLDYYASEAIRPTSAGGGFLVPTPFVNAANATPRGRIMAMHQAVGTCAMVSPWNFPAAMVGISKKKRHYYGAKTKQKPARRL